MRRTPDDRAASLYRALSRVLPPAFRDRWGQDMEDVFLHHLRRAGDSRLRRTAVWVRAAWDLAAEAASLRPTLDHNHHPKEGLGMTTGTQDLRWAARTLRKSPLFTTVAVATLAMGIGASTATFSVVDTVLLESLPYHDADRLVTVWPEENYNKAMVQATADAMPALEGLVGHSRWAFVLTGLAEPMEIDGAQVSPGWFDLLGVRPALGRTFRPEEGEPGKAGVVILSHALWVRAFGADPGVVGRTLDLSAAEYDRRTVIGVMPEGYRNPFGQVELWVPLEIASGTAPENDGSWYVNERVGRLRASATLVQAQDQLRGFTADLLTRMPTLLDEEDVRAASVVPLRQHMAGGVGGTLWATLGAVALVLLMACANVANLLLARGEARSRALAVRAALGAGRERVVSMLLAESLLIGLAGGALGVALAYGLVDLLVGQAPADFPRLGEVGVDARVLAFAVAATLTATLTAGLVPALRGSRVEAVAALGGATRGAGGRRSGRLSRLLVAAEVALAVVVVVGSGLALRSLDRLLAVDPGLAGEGVLTFRVSPPDARYTDGPAYARYFDQVRERLSAIPGVTRVGGINLLPGTIDNWSFPTFVEGKEPGEGETIPSVNFRGVTAGYAETVGQRLLAGRAIADADRADTEKVMVVNEAFVHRFFPGEDPLGRNVRLMRRSGEPYRIVGVVADVRQHGRAAQPRAEMYVSNHQWSWGMSLWVMVRTEGDRPLDHVAAVQDAVWSVDADVPLSDFAELSTVLGQSTRETRFFALLLGGFGLLALALGAVGVFGVTAYTLGERLPEFGVRLALGGSRASVVSSALSRSLRPVGAGLAVGLVGAWASSRLLGSVLYEVEPTDPPTFVAVAVLLLSAGVTAALIPALRVGRVDPVRVLNAE